MYAVSLTILAKQRFHVPYCYTREAIISCSLEVATEETQGPGHGARTSLDLLLITSTKFYCLLAEARVQTT